ncbi:MAG: DUF4105 domain-containing protein [Beijerinckiaceae bacterium]
MSRATRTICVLATLTFGLWGGLALYFRAPFTETGRISVAVLFAITMLAASVFISRRRWRRALIPLALAPVLLIWWQSLTPSNDRDWAPDVAYPATGAVNGDILTVRNVRDFRWRTESDFTPRWETRTYDLNKLDDVDLIASYWAGEDIAHILVSFGFGDGQRLVWSIELRRTKDQSYSALASFFKQSELIFLAADESDIIRLRTNVRRENVRMYPLHLRPGVPRRLLLEYVDIANRYADHPRWYNTITANCTTMVFRIARALHPYAPFNWRVLLSGHFPDLVYMHGGINNAIPFAQWREKAQIDAAAQAADALDSFGFSQAIRVQLAVR